MLKYSESFFHFSPDLHVNFRKVMKIIFLVLTFGPAKRILQGNLSFENKMVVSFGQGSHKKNTFVSKIIIFSFFYAFQDIPS